MKILPELLFDKSRNGKIGYSFDSDPMPDAGLAVDPELTRSDIPGFPSLSEVEIVRHYTNLSHLNHSVDSGFYPLGSCTMKYNPKVNETIAAMPAFTGAHPYTPHHLVQGNITIMRDLENWLCAVTGMRAFSLSPAAGAHGELTGMMLIRRCLTQRGDPRRIVLIPDSAHGTNPASAHFAGYDVREIPSGPDGVLEVETLKANLDADVAALMLTNPNTLGIFERNICELAALLHENGSMLYMDGANMNALMGIVRPGDLGVDVLHLNLHKTFATPHGGGGPGSGPVGVAEHLAPFLPPPVIPTADDSVPRYHRPESIGRVKNFYGNFLVMVRALAYLMSLGRRGLRQVAEDAVLNANYIRCRLKDLLDLPYASRTLHEVIFSDKGLPVSTLDIAKRLLDYGIHPFTIYFPLIVHGAMMIEPTETESLETLDQFIEVMNKILAEAQTDAEKVRHAPYNTPRRRLDEVRAARNPVLAWQPRHQE
ncbi:MAG: aminomethyl-transferring glycine dehydrogenase subunit GcvPB [Acidobacteriota bacterium]|jgi:glycine dehydrogenase subunit 2|nr:aminomethyl-transferring glycine dehydrogenase subunit GcvPB [Acidobacteriota bacterium]